MNQPKRFNPAQPPRREGKLHRVAPRLAQRPGPMRAMIDHARELERLRRRMRQVLPDALREQWQLARLDEAEMVIVASSGAWATRLRYAARQLQEAAQRAGGPYPAHVTVRIAPSAPGPSRLQPPGHLSSGAAETLRKAAAATEDPDLRAALERLASRHKG